MSEVWKRISCWALYGNNLFYPVDYGSNDAPYALHEELCIF
jgi:hypothetical protein